LSDSNNNKLAAQPRPFEKSKRRARRGRSHGSCERSIAIGIASTRSFNLRRNAMQPLRVVRGFGVAQFFRARNIFKCVSFAESPSGAESEFTTRRRRRTYIDGTGRNASCPAPRRARCRPRGRTNFCRTCELTKRIGDAQSAPPRAKKIESSIGSN